MTWRGTTVGGMIKVTDGDRALSALTNEPHKSNIAVLIERVLNALDDAGGDPSGVFIGAPDDPEFDWEALEADLDELAATDPQVRAAGEKVDEMERRLTAAANETVDLFFILDAAAEIMTEATSHFILPHYGIEGLTELVNRGWQIIPPKEHT